MEQVIVEQQEVQPLAEWNGLVYFKGMYITEAERQAYIKEDEQEAIQWQNWLDQQAGKKNASETDVILTVFFNFYQKTIQEVKLAARYLKETSLENFNFDSLSYVSASNHAKNMIIRLKEIKAVVQACYDTLGTPIMKVTKGKSINAYLDSIQRGLAQYYSFAYQLIEGHKAARQKAIEENNLQRLI